MHRWEEHRAVDDEDSICLWYYIITLYGVISQVLECLMEWIQWINTYVLLHSHNKSSSTPTSLRAPWGVEGCQAISWNNTWWLTYTSTVHILFDISESFMGKFRILSRFRCHAGNTSWPLLYCTYLNIFLQSTAITETYHHLWLYGAHRVSRNIQTLGIYSIEVVNEILWGCVWDVCTLQFQASSGLSHVLSK